MNHLPFSRLFALAFVLPSLAAAQIQRVSVAVTTNNTSAEIAPRFLGLSYESSMLLPKDGKYYFNADDKALVQTFQTLGIKSLRVGANAVDDPTVPIPQEKDIDSLFNFARAAGVKVIYSFRLKNGDPADSARLAAYIAGHYADVLDSFSIGNEPNFFLKTYDAFFAQWKPHYDAILKAVPNAMFDGPSASGPYAIALAKDLYADGHLAMVSDHYYFLGSGRAAEKDPPASRARFLTNSLHRDYEKDFAQTGAVLKSNRVPYRIDELNSCYNGGAKDSSDTFASTLWALDCTYWWAQRQILGMNYHTGESVGRDGVFGAANYAAFIHRPDGNGFVMRPQAYALLAFTQGARGRSLQALIRADYSAYGYFNAYAYLDPGGSTYVTLINKSCGDNAHPVSVNVFFIVGIDSSGTWERMDLTQEAEDVSAKTGVTLGGAAVDAQGIWSGQWKKIEGADSVKQIVQVPPASATILRFTTAK
jgi:hypothetical protein